MVHASILNPGLIWLHDQGTEFACSLYLIHAQLSLLELSTVTCLYLG